MLQTVLNREVEERTVDIGTVDGLSSSGEEADNSVGKLVDKPEGVDADRTMRADDGKTTLHPSKNGPFRGTAVAVDVFDNGGAEEGNTVLWKLMLQGVSRDTSALLRWKAPTNAKEQTVLQVQEFG